MKKYLRYKACGRKLKNVFRSMSVSKRRQRSRHFLQKAFGEKRQTHALTLVDVGASEYLPEHWVGLGPYLRIIGFEPDESAYQDLVAKAEKNRTYHPIALAEKAGEVDFFITRKHMASSMLRPNRKLLNEFPNADRFDIMETVKLRTDTLDNVLKPESVDFIKLDTQGSELYILQGASQTLQRELLGVEVEVEFQEMYERQPLFGDIDKFLRESGFVLLDFIQNSRWKRENTSHGKGQSMFADALYMKSKEIIDGKQKLLKAIGICILYAHYDYAFALLQEGLRRKVIEEYEYQRLARALKSN